MATVNLSELAPQPPVEFVDHGASAVAAQQRATVSARYELAIQRPRNWDQVRIDVLRECARPAFAGNKSAYYAKPIGGGKYANGLGIRFVEMALRCMKNVLIETVVTFDGPLARVIGVQVTDLENNITFRRDVHVEKTMERSRPDSDGAYLSVRLNSESKPVYKVAATEDALLNKEAALVSKAIREAGLRIIPGDLAEEGEAVLLDIRKKSDAKDPDAARKAIASAFAEVGVTIEDLESYLGHSLGNCTPKETADLRGVCGAIIDGEATWKTVLENRDAGVGTRSSKRGPKVPAASIDSAEHDATLQKLEDAGEARTPIQGLPPIVERQPGEPTFQDAVDEFNLGNLGDALAICPPDKLDALRGLIKSRAASLKVQGIRREME